MVSSGTMEPYLNKADVFLTDNPETSLLEIMLTDKPIIFYYTGGYSIEKGCKDMLCKRVFWVENSKQLSDTLLSLASNYDQCVRDKDDRSFLEYNFKETVPPEKFIDINFSGDGVLVTKREII